MPIFSLTVSPWRSYLEKLTIWRQIYKQTCSTFYASNMRVVRAEKEELLGRYNKDISLNTFVK